MVVRCAADGVKSAEQSLNEVAAQDRARPLPLGDAILRDSLKRELFGRPQRVESLGRYRVLEQLGAGGMGLVYRARDDELDRTVAVKLVRADVLDARGAEGRAMILREARALAQLSHPNVVQVHDVGELDGQVFIAMELVEGRTLRAWVDELSGRRRRRWSAIVARFLEAGEGLAAAHERGLVHRDFKPENVLVGDDGRVRVMDFGLAARGEAPSGAGSPAAAGEVAAQADMNMGTPAYMAPEQLARREVTARSDQYSFCVALHEALYARHPFELEDRDRLVRAILEGRPRPAPRGSGVPRWLRVAVERGLASDPSRRWPSMRALLTELRRGQVRAQRWIFAGALVVVGGLSAYAWSTRQRPCTSDEDPLANVWDDAMRGLIQEVFHSSELAFADDSWIAVRRQLDDYTGRWVERRLEACQEHHRRMLSGELYDLRVACLERRRASVGALTELLAQADASVIRNAASATEKLEPLEPCADTERLRARLRLAAPEEELVEAVLSVRSSLARARALAAVGRVETAQRQVSALAEVDALRYRPLRAEQQLLLGELELEATRFVEGERALVEASTVAEATRHDAVAAEAMSLLVFALTSQGGEQLDDAERWAQLAAAKIEREQLVGDVRATLANNQGRLAQARGEPERALAFYEQALERAASVHGDDSHRYARAVNNRGAALQVLGQRERALEDYRRSLAIDERLLGESHPDLAHPLNNIGTAQRELGDIASAAESFRRALTVIERSLGAEHEDYAIVVNNLGTTLKDQGELAEARSLYTRAREVLARLHGEQHILVAMIGSNLGELLLHEGHPQQALELLSPARATVEAQLGGEHFNVGLLLVNEGQALLELEALDRAEAAFERARAIFEKTVAPDSPELAYPLTGLGVVALRGERPARAAELLERALELRAPDRAPPRELADTRYALARALLAGPERGRDERRARAKKLAEEAAQGYAAGADEERAAQARALALELEPSRPG